MVLIEIREANKEELTDAFERDRILSNAQVYRLWRTNGRYAFQRGKGHVHKSTPWRFSHYIGSRMNGSPVIVYVTMDGQPAVDAETRKTAQELRSWLEEHHHDVRYKPLPQEPPQKEAFKYFPS